MTSTASEFRESPDSKKMRLDNIALKQAVAESMEIFNLHNQEQALTNLEDIMLKFRNKTLDYSLIQTQHYALFMHIIEVPQPSIKFMVSVGEDMQVSIFVKDVEIKSMGTRKFPTIVKTVNCLEQILSDVTHFFEKPQEDIKEKCSIVIDSLDFIGKQLPEKVSIIKFLQEQIRLLPISKKAVRYSWETILFCSLFHAISPHAYTFF